VKTRHRNLVRLVLAIAVAGSTLSAFSVAASARPHPDGAVPDVVVDWTLGTPAPFAGTRFDGQHVPPLRRIYFLGFRTLGDATDGSVWYYDLFTDTYTDTGVDMPVPVSNYQIAALRDASGLGLYIFGGRDATPTAIDTVQVYYPALNTAVVVSSDPYPGETPSGCTSLPATGVAAFNNKAYVLGGLGFASLGCVDENSSQTWIFDPLAPDGSRWTQGPDLNVARGYLNTAVLGHEIFAIGGDQNIGGTLFATSTVESWMPSQPGWDDAGIADLPTVCGESQAFGYGSGPLGHGIVLAGCGQWPNAVPDTYFYDHATNAWSVVGSLNENRRNHAGAWIPRGDSRATMFVLGGYGEVSTFIDPLFSQETGVGTPSAFTASTGSSSTPAAGVSTN
jgi:hypothetical protein